MCLIVMLEISIFNTICRHILIITDQGKQQSVGTSFPPSAVSTVPADKMELHLPLDPQEVEYLQNQGVTEQLSGKLTQVWNINN